MIHKRVVVSGEVQGVYFRDSCRTEAQKLGIAGWVRNLTDGTVEAAFEGAPDGVDRMVAWAHHGPPTASVDRVEVFDEDVEGLVGFAVRPTGRR